MRIDIIFSDLDGTLLLGDKGLSPGTAEALARAAERGISFVPATGRFFNAIPRAVQELPFWRYAIVMNGAVVWDRAEGRAIRRAELSPELAVRVMARLEDFPGTLDCYMEDNCGWMEARYYAALDDWILDPVSRRIIREMRRPMEDLRGYVGRRGRPVQKIQSYFRDEATQRAVLAALAEEFPAPQAGLPVKFVADHHPYKEQKVRILNGGHTAMVPAAFLAGHDIVRTCMEDPAVRAFLEGALFEEIIPTLSLPRTDCEAFARAVEERFSNPYIDHRLLDIALNSVSKWRARVLPSVNAFLAQNGRAPDRLTFSFAALAAFYTQAERCGHAYPVRDEPAVLDFFAQNSGLAPEALIAALAARTDFWGEDLRTLPGFVPAAGQALARIRAAGMAAALADCR